VAYHWSSWAHRTLVDSDGQTIGIIDEVWPEEQTGRLAWGMVRTTFGHRPVYLPDAELAEGSDEVILQYSRKAIFDAPEIHLDAPLEPATAEDIALHVMAVKPPGTKIGRPRPPKRPPPGSANAGAGEREVEPA
jgi:hypothetical protein